MSQNECGCQSSNCPHRTSEVTLFDGQFTNINVPAGAGLNEVLALLENYITTSASCNDVNYTLNAFNACLNLPAGTYSFEQIIDALISVVCNNVSSITELQEAVQNVDPQNLTTTNTLLTDIIYPCFTDVEIESLSTSTDLFNIILTKLCALLGETGPVVTPNDDPGGGPIVVTPPDPGTTIDPNGPYKDTNVSAYYQNARIEHLAEAFKSIIDNHSFLYDHTMPLVDTTSFVVSVQPMRGVVEDFLVIRKDSEDLTVNPSKDTYFYLSAGGYILRREVNIDDPVADVPVGAHPLYKVTTDGAGVTLVTALYSTEPFNPVPLGVDSVKTINIEDDAVTPDKIAPVTTSVTVGDESLIRIRIDDTGQVLTLTSNLDLTGLSDGDILKYDVTLNKFYAAPNLFVVASDKIPKSNGTDYVASAISEAASQVLVEKKLEINTPAYGGPTEDDPFAILNVVGGPILTPRLTFAEASLLPPIDGYLIYVTSIGGVFTSVGFWGVENTTWVKL